MIPTADLLAAATKAGRRTEMLVILAEEWVAQARRAARAGSAR